MKPFVQSEQESDAAVVGQSLLGNKKRVLLVKEESSTRYKLLQELHKAGLDVELAANGSIALNKIAEVSIDAVIVDSTLADMNGQDLIKQIKRKEGLEDIPYFVCNSDDTRDGWPGRGSKSITKFFFKSATPLENIVADVVSRLGGSPTKRVRSTAASRPTPRVRAAKVTLGENMPEELRNFELLRQAPAVAPASHDAKLVVVAHQHSQPEPAGGDAQRKYLERKIEELTVENIRLQRRSVGNEQLDELKAAAERAEAACQAHVEKCSRLEDELALVRQARDQLNVRLVEEKREAADLRRRNETLDQQLSRASIEVTRYKTELENRAADQGTVETELSAQLIAARSEAASAEAACNQQAARAARFEAEATRLRQAHTELDAKLVQAEQAATQSKQRLDELTRRLATATTEFQRLKGELDKQSGQRETLERELRQQLEGAKVIAEKAQAELTEKNEVFEHSQQKIAALRRSREELNEKCAQEQRATAEATRHSQVLENKLREAAVELKSQSEKHRAECASLQQQLDTAKGATERSTLELRQQTRELENKLTREQHKVTEISRYNHEIETKLRQSQNELTGLKSEFEQHRAQRDSMARELEGVRATGEQANARHSEQAFRANEEIAGLRRAQDELNARVASDQNALAEARRQTQELENRLRDVTNELNGVRGEFEQQRTHRESEQHNVAEAKRHNEELENRLREVTNELNGLRSEFDQQRAHRDSMARELDSARAATEQAHAGYREQLSRANEEINGLRRAHDEFNSRIASEQHNAAEARRHAEGLENRVREVTNELNGLRGEFEQQRAHRDSLARELEAARAATEQAHASYRDQCARANEEVAAVRRGQDELNARLASEQQAVAEIRRQNRELDDKLRQTSTDLSGAQADLGQHRAERETLLRECQAAKTAAETAKAACADQASALVHANDQLAVLQRAREELNAKVVAERQAASEARRHRHDLEDKLRDALTDLTSLKADLNKQVRERTTLAKQSDVARSLAKKAQSNLNKEAARGNRLAKHVAVLRKSQAQLNSKLEKEQQNAAESRRHAKQLEARLSRSLAQVERATAELERRHPGDGTGLDGRVRDCVGALARATADLEQERKRLEATALHSGHSSLDAARVGRAFVNSFRSQMRMTTENLIQSLRSALEAPLDGEQKRLVQSAHENALLLQASLQEEPPVEPT
jgi:chromosome segregation ATPase/CheY-like chemotaxis protein